MTKKRTNNPDRETFKSLLESIEKFTQEDVDYLMEDLDSWGFFKMFHILDKPISICNQSNSIVHVCM